MSHGTYTVDSQPGGTSRMFVFRGGNGWHVVGRDHDVRHGPVRCREPVPVTFREIR